MTSIRRYLTQTLLLVVFLGAGLSGLAAWFITDHEMDEIFDAQLAQLSRVVAGMIDGNMDERDYRDLAMHLNQPDYPATFYGDDNHHAPDHVINADNPPRRFMQEERLLSMGFWNDDRSPRLLSAGWNEAGPFPPPREVGYRWVEYGGENWRVFSLNDRNSHTWISIGLHEDFQEELARKIVYANSLPYLFILPLLALAIWWVIRRGLRPIDALSQQVAQRHHQDLSTIDRTTPRELEGLRGALNAFIGRLQLALDRERRFTADAAHELRTPLAAVKIHLDNAFSETDETSASQPPGSDVVFRRAALAHPTPPFTAPTRSSQPYSPQNPSRYSLQRSSLYKAHCGIERLQRVVDQLLTLARLERAPQRPPAVVDLYPIAAQLSGELWPLADAQGQQLEIEGLDYLAVRADPTELGVLLRNLLDNALRYTPAGGQVTLELTREEGRPTIRVLDNGPGIEVTSLDKVTERFHRTDHQRTTGSGLGLAIVKELVQRQHATLCLANRTHTA